MTIFGRSCFEFYDLRDIGSDTFLSTGFLTYMLRITLLSL